MSYKSLKLDWEEVDGGEVINFKASLFDGDSILKVKHFDNVSDEVDGYQLLIEWLGFGLEEVWTITDGDD